MKLLYGRFSLLSLLLAIISSGCFFLSKRGIKLITYYRSLYISEHSPLINTMKILYFSSFKIELYPFTSWHGHPLILFVHTCLQVILESLDKGVREGRQQVQAWLALLAARYNEALSSDARAPPSSIDVDFSQCPQLQMLPQLVFALLRSPLLRLHEEGVHPDYRIYLQCLFRFIIFFWIWIISFLEVSLH